MFINTKITKIPSTLFDQTIISSITDRDCTSMFYNIDTLTTIQQGFSIPANITDMTNMFSNNTYLAKIPSSLFNQDILNGISNRNCYSMFQSIRL